MHSRGGDTVLQRPWQHPMQRSGGQLGSRHPAAQHLKLVTRLWKAQDLLAGAPERQGCRHRPATRLPACCRSSGRCGVAAWVRGARVRHRPAHGASEQAASPPRPPLARRLPRQAHTRDPDSAAPATTPGRTVTAPARRQLFGGGMGLATGAEPPSKGEAGGLCRYSSTYGECTVA